MTASADRRRRITTFGFIAGAVGVVAVIAVSVLAVVTLRSSEEGQAPVLDDRGSMSFPTTPNAVLGVVDDFDRLTSLAVATLGPSGIGGSIVVVPVNADQTNGFGPNRLPISRQPYTPGDEDQEAQLVSELEPLLTLTIERVSVVGPEELAVLFEPLGAVDVDLPERVVDSDTPGSGPVARAGEQQLATDELVEAFTAINAEGLSYSHHDVDVALWRGVAAAAGGSSVAVATDEFDRPVSPDGTDEFWERLLGGDVAARDIAVDRNAAQAADNDTEADFVLVDRRDALLVFGSVSPGLVSKPNESLSFSLVVGFDEAQVAVLGEGADGQQITKTSMTRRFIGEMLFAQANIVSVTLGNTPSTLPAVTRIEIADAAFEADVRAVSQRFFGDAEIVVAGTITDGVDAVVILGSDFLVQRAELLEIEREQAREAGAATEDDGDSADFDVSDSDAADDSAGSSDVDSGDGTDPNDQSSDTVPDDE